MQIKPKRLLGIIITIVLTINAVIIVYDYLHEKPAEQQTVFIPEQRRAHLYMIYKKEFQSRIKDTVVLDKCCKCLADTMVKRYTNEELNVLNKKPEQEQLRLVGDILIYCRKTSGLDSLLNKQP